MKNMKYSKVVILILICALQLAFSLFWANRKSYLFMDELFSYAAANRAEGVIAELPANEWLDEGWYLDYVTADQEHRFDYSIPYRNQDADVHPPLFYLFLHTACSLIPEEFSYVAGMAFNILFFMACTIVLYFLGKEVFRDEKAGLLTAFLFSISYGGIDTMTFIRMYMLLALLVLLHTLVYMKYFELEEVPLKGYVLLGLTIVLGALTQYYFVIIAFFFGVWYAVRFICKKQYRSLGKYIATAVLSAAASLAIYPTMWKHLFGTTRGLEAIENFSSSEGYFEKVKTMWKLMDSQLFTNLFVLILLAMLVLAVIVYLKRREQISRSFCLKAGAILLACAGYFMVVTKIAPYQIARYLMPIYPLIYLLVIGVMYRLAVKIMPVKVVIVLCVLGFGGLSAVHMVHSGIPHTYSKDVVITPRVTVAEENQEKYALYIGEREEDIPKYYDILQVLSKYQGYYYIDGSGELSDVKQDMTLLENEKQILLYVDENTELKKAAECIEELFPGVTITEECLLHADEGWDVYLVDGI